MKKILFFLSLVLFPFLLQAQLSGSGTFADPYSGVFQGNLQWNYTNFSSGKVYISGDLTIDNELLTIEAGMSIIFVNESANLKINGTGQIIATGTNGSMITFTADDDNDGNYGESGERWGHISFENSTGNSIIDFCIIEFGSKTGAGTEGYGGGLQVNTNNLTISNSIFRNNTAIFGGGIFVNKNRSTPVSNCLFTDNSASYAGGGLYFWDGSSSVVSNCIITNNQVTASYKVYLTGGGLAAISNTTIIVSNCTFVNNSSNSTEGKSMVLYGGSTAPIIRNSVFWGSSNQIYLSGPASSVIQFCAVQGSSFTNSINLSSGNTDITGPNFVATDGSNWAINFISPCRDAGITPNPVLPIDYIGNSRIGPYDIGAYEVQYSRWLTNASSPTSWTSAGNWEQGIYPGLAGTTGDVIIPNLTDATYAPNISGTTTLNAGKSMILEAGGKATFATLTNNGTLKLNSSASGNASLILNTYTKGGGSTEEIQLFLTGGGTKTPLTYKWHYISSPVTSLPVSTFAPTYTLNVAQWVESNPFSSLTQGWIAYDGYQYYNGVTGTNTFSTLTPGKGYNFFDATDNTFTFSGQLNTGDVNATLNYTSLNDQLYGYNLIGNPFSSGLDWNYIIANGFPLNTTKSLYFTRNSTLCTYINGVGVPGDVNGIIPPMQGFFSKTYSAGNTIVLAAAARTHNNIHATYKGSKALIPLVRLALADSLLTDETVVRFDDQAKSYLDNDFDAVKMFLDPSLSSIHTSLGGTDYAINGLPFPETLLEIPVTLNIATDEETKSITASELQSLDNYNVTLTDISTGFVANLRTTPTVTFAAAKGTVAGRFILKISTITTGVETPVTTNNKFNIYPANNNINIQTVADEWEGKSGSVRVLDLTGKTISDLKNTEFRKNSLTQVASPGASGIYVVEIRAGNMRYVGKVVIR